MTKIDGISDIQTDIPKRTCSFKYAKSESELKAQLDEFAKTNSHIRDWTKKG